MENLSLAPSLQTASSAAHNKIVTTIECLHADSVFVACVPVSTTVNTNSRHIVLKFFEMNERIHLQSEAKHSLE